MDRVTHRRTRCKIRALTEGAYHMPPPSKGVPGSAGGANSTARGERERKAWRARERLKGRQNSGWFFRMPVEVLESPSYCALSFKARALLFDLGSQFRGKNNGDLAAAWSLMRQRGWKSKDTLQRALRELIDAGMIEQTRQGGLHCASLFAFTWLPIEECGGKLDVRATIVPSALWRKNGQVA